MQHQTCARHSCLISKVAKTEKDACSLIDAGFEFACDLNRDNQVTGTDLYALGKHYGQT